MLVLLYRPVLSYVFLNCFFELTSLSSNFEQSGLLNVCVIILKSTHLFYSFILTVSRIRISA